MWLGSPKEAGQVLFIKTMRAISQLYKGPIVQDKEIMISSHLRLHIGKELHSYQQHIQGPEDRTLSKEEPCCCPALTGSCGGLCFLGSHASRTRCGSHWLLKRLLGAKQSCGGVWLLPPGFQRLPQCLVERELWCGWRRKHRAATTVIPSRPWEWVALRPTGACTIQPGSSNL